MNGKTHTTHTTQTRHPGQAANRYTGENRSDSRWKAICAIVAVGLLFFGGIAFAVTSSQGWFTKSLDLVNATKSSSFLSSLLKRYTAPVNNSIFTVLATGEGFLGFDGLDTLSLNLDQQLRLLEPSLAGDWGTAESALYSIVAGWQDGNDAEPLSGSVPQGNGPTQGDTSVQDDGSTRGSEAGQDSGSGVVQGTDAAHDSAASQSDGSTQGSSKLMQSDEPVETDDPSQQDSELLQYIEPTIEGYRLTQLRYTFTYADSVNSATDARVRFVPSGAFANSLALDDQECYALQNLSYFDYATGTLTELPRLRTAGSPMYAYLPDRLSPGETVTLVYTLFTTEDTALALESRYGELLDFELVQAESNVSVFDWGIRFIDDKPSVYRANEAKRIPYFRFGDLTYTIFGEVFVAPPPVEEEEVEEEETEGDKKPKAKPGEEEDEILGEGTGAGAGNSGAEANTGASSATGGDAETASGGSGDAGEEGDGSVDHGTGDTSDGGSDNSGNDIGGTGTGAGNSGDDGSGTGDAGTNDSDAGSGGNGAGDDGSAEPGSEGDNDGSDGDAGSGSGDDAGGDGGGA